MAYLDVHTDEVREIWQGRPTERLIEMRQELSAMLSKASESTSIADDHIHNMMGLQSAMQKIDRELESRSDGILEVKHSKNDGVLTLDFNIGGIDFNSLEINTVFGEESRGMFVCFAYAEWWDGAIMVENGLNGGRFKTLHSPSRTYVVVIGSRIKAISIVTDSESEALACRNISSSIEEGVEELNRKFYV